MIVTAASPIKALEVDGVVTRCGCTPEQKAAPDFHALRGVICPRPRAIEDLGRMAYWHRNPLRRLAWTISQLVRGRRPGTIRIGG